MMGVIMTGKERIEKRGIKMTVSNVTGGRRSKEQREPPFDLSASLPVDSTYSEYVDTSCPFSASGQQRHKRMLY